MTPVAGADRSRGAFPAHTRDTDILLARIHGYTATKLNYSYATVMPEILAFSCRSQNKRRLLELTAAISIPWTVWIFDTPQFMCLVCQNKIIDIQLGKLLPDISAVKP